MSIRINKMAKFNPRGNYFGIWLSTNQITLGAHTKGAITLKANREVISKLRISILKNIKQYFLQYILNNIKNRTISAKENSWCKR